MFAIVDVRMVNPPGTWPLTEMLKIDVRSLRACAPRSTRPVGGSAEFQRSGIARDAVGTGWLLGYRCGEIGCRGRTSCPIRLAPPCEAQ